MTMERTTAARRALTQAMFAFLELRDEEIVTLCGMVGAPGLAEMDAKQLEAVCTMVALAQSERTRRAPAARE